MRRLPLGGQAALAVVGGLAQTLSFAPYEAWWLQLLAVALLYGLTEQASPKRAFALGWLFAAAWLASGLWWLYISLHDFGGMAAPLAVACVLVLAAFLALYLGAAMMLAAWLRPGVPALLHPVLWAGCWLLATLARAVLLSGFPWIAGGYAHTLGLLAPWAPWIGVYGIDFLAAWLAASAAAVLCSAAGRGRTVPQGTSPSVETLLPRRGSLLQRALAAGAVLVLVAAGSALPHNFTQETGTLAVSLVQPNVPQDEKFDRARLESQLRALIGLTGQARGAVVITPESVLPLPLAYLPQDALDALVAQSRERPLLLGTFLGDSQSGYVNSLAAFGGMQPYAYGKRHLLPFGETIPPGFGWFVRALRIPMDDQARGQVTASWSVAGERLRPLICYEDLFGEDFVESAVGPEAATVFVNASNLAWFGRHMVQEQHLQFSQMRALEFQRPFVRATNTGATAAIDHRGRVQALLTPWTRGVLEVRVQGRRGETPYARWLHLLGLWPWGVLLAGGLGAAAWRRWRLSDRAADLGPGP